MAGFTAASDVILAPAASAGEGTRTGTSANEAGWPRLPSLCELRHQHGVDHMDHPVGLHDVSGRDHRVAALGVRDRPAATGLHEG